jgi:hypothetical protein
MSMKQAVLECQGPRRYRAISISLIHGLNACRNEAKEGSPWTSLTPVSFVIRHLAWHRHLLQDALNDLADG